MGSTSVTAVLAACCYYLFAWLIVSPKPNRKSIMPRYEPPSGLSPAMLRYIWKDRFDDRTFWASVLSLVSKDLATIKTVGDGVAALHATSAAQHPPTLPEEENLLLRRALSGSKRAGASLSMLDGKTAFVAGQMAESLNASTRTFFADNRRYTIAGAAISAIAVCLVARPSGKDRWMGLVLGLGVIAPGAFYLSFLLLRIRDVYLSACEKLQAAILRRGILLLVLTIPCVAAVALGIIVLTSAFGWLTVVSVALLTILTLLFSVWSKVPTPAGLDRLNEIEGFRVFLQSVDRLPMDRADAPGDHAGVYEKYLPYAVALELDQKWNDQVVAMASTLHRSEALVNAHSFYLGMWNGKPVEMVFTPPPPGSRF